MNAEDRKRLENIKKYPKYDDLTPEDQDWLIARLEEEIEESSQQRTRAEWAEAECNVLRRALEEENK